MEIMVGQIQLLPFSETPRGWALCDGQPLDISEYGALYYAIGTRFGGNGKTTFNLPNLRGKSPSPSMEYYIAVIGIAPSLE